ncbi:unnamed protein product [Pedinophyceae sp. YPF-701]|nr:unnamed protein product [Pedinophyceae sp. YPF-701]
MGFKVPDWATPPQAPVHLEPVQGGAPIDLGAQEYYVFGRDADSCQVVLEGASRQHAAAVHHQDGRLFLIDLGSTNGTFVDHAQLAKHKPLQLRDGMIVRFAKPEHTFVVRGSGAHAARPEDAERRARNEERAARAGTEPETVQCLHLLLKHSGSRRPANWKGETITRSLEEARAGVLAFRERIVQGESFEELAQQHSDCSSAKRGGDLGPFSRGQMQRPFEDASFRLAVGEISGLVESDSGVHIIKRIA